MIRRSSNFPRPRRPAKGSIRFYEERWATALPEECVKDLAKLSYQNDRLRARLASVENDLEHAHDQIIRLIHVQDQIRASIELLVMKKEAGGVLTAWPSIAKSSRKPD